MILKKIAHVRCANVKKNYKKQKNGYIRTNKKFAQRDCRTKQTSDSCSSFPKNLYSIENHLNFFKKTKEVCLS